MVRSLTSACAPEGAAGRTFETECAAGRALGDTSPPLSLVPPEKVAESVACGPDPDKHVAQVREYVEADIDEVYVQQIGPDMDGFFAAWERDVLPAVRG